MQFVFWCVYCKHKTPHEYRPRLQGERGLAYRCERCQRISEKTAHHVSMAELTTYGVCHDRTR